MPFGPSGGGGRRGGRREHQVLGPFRSQSSIPSIRRQATRAEHRPINPFDVLDDTPSSPSPPSALTHLLAPAVRYTEQRNPALAMSMARFHGTLPTDEGKQTYGRSAYQRILDTALIHKASEEGLQEDPIAEAVIGALATAGVGTAANLLKGGASAAVGAATGAQAASDASTAARLAAGLRAASGAAKATKAAKVAKAAGRAAAFPLRHPFITSGAPLAVEAPGAALHADPGRLKNALEGTGVLAAALGDAGGAARNVLPGVVGNAAADALSLPAQVLPSLYLTGKAGVKAATGDTGEAENLLREWGETSAIPALATGQFGEALDRAGEHPLYTALEAAAVKAGVGRGAGAALRRSGHPDFQHEKRPPLTAYGDVYRPQGDLSNDVFTRMLQRRADARRPESPYGGLEMRPREKTKHLQQALDREVYTGDVVRRGEQRRTQHEINQMRPADDATAGAARLAMEGYARDPQRAMADLAEYRDNLIAQQDRLPPSFREANQGVVDAIDAAIQKGDPQAMFEAATAYARHQAPVTKELVRLGILDEHQAAKATEIPYARTWMGAKHGLSRADEAMYEQVKQEMSQPGLSAQERGQMLGRLSRIRSRTQTLGPEGEPLSLEQIRAHMKENGVEDSHSFISQKLPEPARPGAFYRPPTDYPSLRGPARTGEASDIGAFDPSWDAPVEQAVHSQTLLDQARGYRERLERFSLHGPEGKTFSDYRQADHFTKHPEDFGAELPDIPGGWVPVAESPWLARKETAEALADTGSAGSALAAVQGTEHFVGGIAENMLQPGPGRYRVIPKTVADRLRQHYAEVSPTEKGVQAVTGTLKGAWLPTSPKWITGNAADNYVVRSLGTGITPADMVSGKRFVDLFGKVMTPRERARAVEPMISGGLYGSYPRVTPHREMQQFVGTSIEPLARAAHAVLSAPGVRTAAEYYRRYRDTVFEFDSKFIEQTPQYGQLSKVARKELNMSRRQFRRAVAAQDDVIMDYIRGFRDPEKVDHMARQIERVFGNWGKVSPEARRFLNTLAPFWQWGRSALKFAFVTLPRDHPMLTGILAATEQMTREERQKLGLDSEGKEPLPGFLQGGVPGLGGDGIIGLSGLTTFGTFADPAEFAGNMFAPQVSSIGKALGGLDWKGDQLVDSLGRPANTLERVKAAVTTGVEQFVPFLNVARSIVKHGPKGALPAREYPPSTADYLRGLSNTQQINVPVTEGSSDSGSTNPFDALDSGLEGTNPFDALDSQLP